MPAITPFEKVLPLDFPVGKKGVVVVGAKGQEVKIPFSYSQEKNADDGTTVVVLADRLAVEKALKDEQREQNGDLNDEKSD